MITALVPALQSNWLVMHVTVMILVMGFISWLLISNLLFNRCFFSRLSLAQTGK
jgi:ABC-type transport system involved in cytochrome c biogenesis permease subunit